MKNQVISFSHATQDRQYIPKQIYGYWAWTPESCALHGDITQAVKTVFRMLPAEYQHAFTVTSNPGQWVARALIWRKLLMPFLPPKQYHRAMQEIVRSYSRARKRQKIFQERRTAQ